MDKEEKYKYFKQWLKTDKGKTYRNVYRKKNYQERNWGDGSRTKYTDEEIDLILNSDLTDAELAFTLKRSVQGIQVKRCKLKKDLKDNSD